MSNSTTTIQNEPRSTVRCTDLLACPFCGKTPEITKHFKEAMWQLIHRCEVMPTMVIDWRDTQQQIADQWNTRKQANK